MEVRLARIDIRRRIQKPFLRATRGQAERHDLRGAPLGYEADNRATLAPCDARRGPTRSLSGSRGGSWLIQPAAIIIKSRSMSVA